MNEVFNGVKHQSKYFRRKPKTIADVRAIDERVKHVNGVFSLENTERSTRKGLYSQAELAQNFIVVQRTTEF